MINPHTLPSCSTKSPAYYTHTPIAHASATSLIPMSTHIPYPHTASTYPHKPPTNPSLMIHQHHTFSCSNHILHPNTLIHNPHTISSCLTHIAYPHAPHTPPTFQSHILGYALFLISA
ncbi:hypothetical protein DPMN_032566 [Dreissena polymorpha]|uniref:Uncharacterized protein n=1 Tax=Dreissena polymorpha TaxID=45954 RepID=A0A9D4RK73_DREPO|nr:hypothetical protein DPMN_032566 [Dreissena polymorpha]